MPPFIVCMHFVTFFFYLTTSSFVPFLSSELEVFGVGSTYPQAKMLTFYRKEPFTLEARYPGPNHFQPLIGK